MDKKKLLILNGSFCEQPLIEKAKEMGFYVITTGNMPELIGHKYADEYIEADYSDKDAILKIVKDNNIEYIQSCANDFGVLTAAYVAEKMGWKGHDTYKNAELLHHKDLFKEFVKENNIPAPISEKFTNKEIALDYINKVEYPIIVKPNDLTGGKGILRANNKEEAKIAIENAFNRSRDKVVLIEPFIEGTQHTFVGFLINKKVYAWASCNCYSIVNPYLIQTETFPATGIERDKEELIKIEETIAEKLDLVDGIFALQYLKKNDKIYVIETMRRPFGNQFLTLCRLHSGFEWEQAQLLAETGNNPKIPIGKPKRVYCGHHGIMIKQNGIVDSYEIDEDFKKHIFNIITIKQSGDKISDYMNERIAYLYYEYDDINELNAVAKYFNNKIHVKLKSE